MYLLSTDYCTSNPCGPGRCEETMTGYACHCHSEFTGTHCEIGKIFVYSSSILLNICNTHIRINTQTHTHPHKHKYTFIHNTQPHTHTQLYIQQKHARTPTHIHTHKHVLARTTWREYKCIWTIAGGLYSVSIVGVLNNVTMGRTMQGVPSQLSYCEFACSHTTWHAQLSKHTVHDTFPHHTHSQPGKWWGCPFVLYCSITPHHRFCTPPTKLVFLNQNVQHKWICSLKIWWLFIMFGDFCRHHFHHNFI